MLDPKTSEKLLNSFTSVSRAFSFLVQFHLESQDKNIYWFWLAHFTKLFSRQDNPACNKRAKGSTLTLQAISPRFAIKILSKSFNANIVHN